MTDPVRALGTRRTNAEAIVDCVTLGYRHPAWRVLDPTHGYGRMWNHHINFDRLTASDLNPAKSPIGRPIDFRALPFGDGHFDATVLDGPYKLNGTSTGEGGAAADEAYGVDDRYVSIDERHQLICDGITEAARVTTRYVLIKCQDQVSSGAVQWQTRIFADHAETVGLDLVDSLLVPSYIENRAEQVHARRDYSTLLITKKEATR